MASALTPETGVMVRWGANVAALTLTGDAWRLLTSMFLHIGLVHILFNMYMLFAFGPLVEAQFGRTRFGLVYLLSGLFGSLWSAVFHGEQMQIVVAAGASGALMGICGAYVGHWVVSNERGIAQAPLTWRGPLAQTIGLNLILGFINPAVDNACHIGGLVSGIILGAAFALGDFEYSKLKRAAASLFIAMASLGSIYLVLQRPPSAKLAQVGMQLREELNATTPEEQRRLQQVQIDKDREEERQTAPAVVSQAVAAGVVISLDPWAQGMVPGPSGERFYIPTDVGNTLRVVDVASKKLVKTITGVAYKEIYEKCTGAMSGGCMAQGANAVALSPDERTAYVTSMVRNSVAVVDLEAGKVVGIIKAGRVPRAIAVTADGTRAYVLNGVENTLVALDLANRKMIGTPAALGALELNRFQQDRTLNLWLARDEKEAWIVDSNTNRLLVMDVASTPMQVTGSVVLPFENLEMFAWHVDTALGRAWVLSKETLTIVDLADKKITQRVALCRNFDRGQLAVNQDGTMLAVASERDHLVSLIKLSTRKTIAVFPYTGRMESLRFGANQQQLFAMSVQPDPTESKARMSVIDTTKSMAVAEALDGTEFLCRTLENMQQ